MRRVVAPFLFAVVACAGGSGTRFDKTDAGEVVDLSLGCPKQARAFTAPIPEGAWFWSVDVHGGTTYLLYTEESDTGTRSSIVSLTPDGASAVPVQVAEQTRWTTLGVYDSGMLVAGDAETRWFPKDGDSTTIRTDEIRTHEGWAMASPWLRVEGGELLRLGQRSEGDYPALLALALDGVSPTRVLRHVYDRGDALQVTDAGLWMKRWNGNQVLLFPLDGDAPGTPLARDCNFVSVDGHRFACVENEARVVLYEEAQGVAEEQSVYEAPEGGAILTVKMQGGRAWFVERTEEGTQRLLRMDEHETRVIACGVTPNMRVGGTVVVTLGSGNNLYAVDL